MNAALVLALLAPTAEPVPDARATVERGLEWLVKQQKDDGSWDGGQGQTATMATARAGLALLMQGSTTSSGKYAPNLRKAVEWFEAIAQADGLLVGKDRPVSGNLTYMHSQALVFLVSAADAESDPVRAQSLTARVEKSVKFLLDNQSARGGWGESVELVRTGRDDAFNTGEALAALFAARKAGFAVPRRATDRGLAYLAAATNADGSISYDPRFTGTRPSRGGSPDVTVSAAAFALASGDQRPTELRAWVRSARAELGAFEGNLAVSNYYNLQQTLGYARVARALGESGHERLDPAATGTRLVWSVERARLFKVVSKLQLLDGSWADQYGSPVYATALALGILQLDSGYVPAFTP